MCTKVNTNLSCQKDKVIYILLALYGGGFSGCSSDCTNRVNGEHTLKSLCQGRQNCKITVDTATLGDPNCTKTTTPTLKVKYKCDYPGECS